MMKSTSMKCLAKPLATFIGLSYGGSALADYAINLPTPVTPTAHEILSLHNLMFFICLAIFFAVFGVMFYSIYAHRKSKGAKPASFYHSTKLEIIWTVIPIIILIVVAVPSTATLLRMEDTSKSDMTVKITGYQWFWQYEYLDSGVDFYSKLSTPRSEITGATERGENYLLEVDNEVVLPVGKKVRLLFTASDVIHSWWMPEFGVKKDAIPGMITESWVQIDEPGIYRGQCTELCGKDHGFMPVVVRAVSQPEFDQWVAQNSTSPAETAAQSLTMPAHAVVSN